jgi:hypothetical protein
MVGFDIFKRVELACHVIEEMAMHHNKDGDKNNQYKD